MTPELMSACSSFCLTMAEKMVLGMFDLYTSGSPYLSEQHIQKKGKQEGSSDSSPGAVLERYRNAMTEIAAAGMVLQTRPVNPGAYFHYFKTLVDAWNAVAFQQVGWPRPSRADESLFPTLRQREDETLQQPIAEEPPAEKRRVPVSTRKTSKTVSVSAEQPKAPSGRRKKARSDRKRVENLFIPLKGFLENQ